MGQDMERNRELELSFRLQAGFQRGWILCNLLSYLSTSRGTYDVSKHSGVSVFWRERIEKLCHNPKWAKLPGHTASRRLSIELSKVPRAHTFQEVKQRMSLNPRWENPVSEENPPFQHHLHKSGSSQTLTRSELHGTLVKGQPCRPHVVSS